MPVERDETKSLQMWNLLKCVELETIKIVMVGSTGMGWRSFYTIRLLLWIRINIIQRSGLGAKQFTDPDWRAKQFTDPVWGRNSLQIRIKNCRQQQKRGQKLKNKS